MCGASRSAAVTPGVPPMTGQGGFGAVPMQPDALGTGGSAPMPLAPPAPTLASNVRIAQLALYQPVKIALMQDGEEVVQRNAPIVAGKRALLRVFVEPAAGFSAHELTARLELSSSEASAQPLTVTQRVAAASTDAELTSTINFDLPAELVTEDLRYRVQLEEPAGAAASGSPDSRVRWPLGEGELAELGARDPGPFRVVIVPYRYRSDGSGRLPVVSDAEMATYRAYLAQMYPASKIELSVHEPVDFTSNIGPQSGWEQWLDTHCALRQEEKPDPKVFYYGMIAPRASWKEYGGGIAGISNLPSPAANFGRCSVGIGFAGFAFVAAHELGHALGLEHAPCGTSGGAFPYDEAVIGVWGFDFTSGKLIGPDKSHDLMSYCDPPFISDYNYERLFERIRYLNIQFAVVERVPTTYQRVLVDSSGRATLRGSSNFDLPPGGPTELRSVSLLDASGRAMAQSEAYFFPFSEGRSGIWFIPDAGFPAARIAGVGDVPLY